MMSTMDQVVSFAPINQWQQLFGTHAHDLTYLPTYDGCYVCGQAHPRGLRIRFFVGAFGQVHALFRPDHTLTGYESVVHGGAVSAICDEILGWPIALQTGRMSVTGELTVRYVRPMATGRTYLVTAHPGTDRGRYWEGTGDIRDERGKVYARVRGKYFLLSAEKTSAIAERLTYHPGDPPVFRYKYRKAGSRGPGQGTPKGRGSGGNNVPGGEE